MFSPPPHIHTTGVRTALTGLGLAAALLLAQSASAALVTYDFSSGNQGFTAAAPTGVASAFFYDGGNDDWRVNGASDVGTARLAAPTIVALGGPLTISFTHAWDFEDGFDGGQLRYSLNGGAEQLLSSFTQLGYTGTILGGSSPIRYQSAWTGTGSGTSIATLAGLGAGDTLAFVWQGAWDTDSASANPNWRLTSVTIDNQPESVPVPGTLALLTLGFGVLLRRRRRC